MPPTLCVLVSLGEVGLPAKIHSTSTRESFEIIQILIIATWDKSRQIKNIGNMSSLALGPDLTEIMDIEQSSKKTEFWWCLVLLCGEALVVLLVAYSLSLSPFLCGRSTSKTDLDQTPNSFSSINLQQCWTWPAFPSFPITSVGINVLPYLQTFWPGSKREIWGTVADKWTYKWSEIKSEVITNM